MRKLSSAFLFIALLISATGSAQDTIRVYFEFGKSNIPENQTKKLNEIRNLYDLNELDSLHYIGTADSVGNIKANFKLSEKRARNTAKYCNVIFPENTQ